MIRTSSRSDWIGLPGGRGRVSSPKKSCRARTFLLQSAPSNHLFCQRESRLKCGDFRDQPQEHHRRHQHADDYDWPVIKDMLFRPFSSVLFLDRKACFFARAYFVKTIRFSEVFFCRKSWGRRGRGAWCGPGAGLVPFSQSCCERRIAPLNPVVGAGLLRSILSPRQDCPGALPAALAWSRSCPSTAL